MCFSSAGGLLSGLAAIKASKKSAKQADKQAEIAESNSASQNQYLQQMAGLAQDQLQMAKDQWSRYQSIYDPYERASAEEATREIGLYAPLKNQEVAYRTASLDDAQRRLSLYAPLEESIVQEATQDPQYSRAMGQASADVHSAFQGARESNARTAAGLGLSANRLASMQAATRLQEAAADAAGRTNARAAVDNQTWAKKLSAMGLRGGATANLEAPRATTSSTGLTSSLGLMSGAMSGLGSVAGAYGNRAAAYNSMSGASANDAAQGLYGGLSLLQRGLSGSF